MRNLAKWSCCLCCTSSAAFEGIVRRRLHTKSWLYHGMQIKMQQRSRKRDETANKQNETAKDSDAFAFEPSFKRRRCSRAKKEYYTYHRTVRRRMSFSSSSHLISQRRDSTQMENKKKTWKETSTPCGRLGCCCKDGMKGALKMARKQKIGPFSPFLTPPN